MTTTVRPTGPERRDPGGGRERAYEIRVDSRPVGRLRLATCPRYGPAVGRVAQLLVDEPERRRGRGTVAALAAEEVLRGQWGCERVEVSLPADAEAALSLAGQLGYRERSRRMRKVLGEAPPLPAGAAVRAMTDEEFSAWRDAESLRYARTLREHEVPPAQAERCAADSLRRLLPRGAATPGALLRVLTRGDRDVGTLWLTADGRQGSAGDGQQGDGGRAHAVYAVHVPEQHRRLGHGRTLMLLAERECLAAAGRTLGLTVYRENAPARALYASLGYRPVEHHLYKRLL